MNRWDLIAGVTALVSRVPVERLFTRDHTKGLDEFEERLNKKGLLVSCFRDSLHKSYTHASNSTNVIYEVV